jgi:threonylcarbamoyladenosine tRNA methylthiotransferase CDKAL1
VKFSRGKLRSKSLSAVVEEFDEGLANGYTDFALIATDLGAHGRDHGITLAALLKEMVKRDGEYRIMLRNVHPRYLIEMMPDLREIFRSGKISYLGSAVQSGNDRILRLMRRRYSVDDFKRTILTMNHEFPEIRLNTQIMVGFPSETEEEFSDTIRLLDDIHIDFVEVYVYQARPRTKAAQMEESVPRSVATRRFYRLYFRSLFKEYKVLVW